MPRFMRRLKEPNLDGPPHFTRYAMYKRIRSVVGGLVGDGAGLQLLSIGSSSPLARNAGLVKAEITKANYPQFDMLSLPMADNSFDIVLSDQVLEHVEGNPFQAFHETVRVARPGGLIIHTTCFFNEIHGAPQDYWRFTPYGLRLLCRGVAEPISIDSSGGLAILPVSRLGLRFIPISNARLHPLRILAERTNALLPVSVWVIARKPDPDGAGPASATMSGDVG